jgi:hypothetical protein
MRWSGGRPGELTRDSRHGSFRAYYGNALLVLSFQRKVGVVTSGGTRPARPGAPGQQRAAGPVEPSAREKECAVPEPTAPRATATTRPQPVLNESDPPRRPASAGPRHRRPWARISGMRVALSTGAVARVIKSRRIMGRHSRRPSAG